MRKTLSLVAAAAFALGLAPAAHAEKGNVEFSATMVQSMPNQQDTSTRIYVGDNVMRSESEFQGQPRISIVDTASRVAWMLNPAKKEYVEMRAQAGAAPGAATANRPPLPDEPGSPCQQDNKGFQCERLGMETVNGRNAEKWRFTATQGDQTMTSLVWVDKELRMPIRQELPGGAVSELKNIQVGPQPVRLFQVPPEYTRIEMPQRGQGQGR
jgi:hypothetical protein